MKRYGWIAVLLTVVLFVILVSRMPCRCKKYEGFVPTAAVPTVPTAAVPTVPAAAPDKNMQVVQDVLSKIKRVSGYLLNRETWTDGLKLHGKSAVEIARMQILSEKSRG